MNSIRERAGWHRIGVAVATVAAGAWTGAVSADTLSFQQDVSPDPTYITASVGIQNTGLNTANENFFATGQLAVGFDGGARRSVFEFDLSAIEAAQGGTPFTIDAVQLNLHANFVSSLAETFHVELHLLGNNDDFDKFSITWNNAPTTPGGTLGTLLSEQTFTGPGPLLTQPFTLSLTSTPAFRSAVQDALDNGDNSIRMILVAPEAEAAGVLENVRFTSNNASTDSTHPELIVNFNDEIISPPPPPLPPPPDGQVIPLPGAAWMALSMLGGLGGIRGLRKRFKK